MPSCATPSSPIPTPRAEAPPAAVQTQGRARSSSVWRLRCLRLSLAWVVGWGGLPLAFGHEIGDRNLPEDIGWSASAKAAVRWLQADAPLPAGPWPGFLVDGANPRDERGRVGLEHGTLSLALRLTPQWGAQLALARHGQEPPHWEALRLEARASGAWGADWQASLGRDTVRAGPVIDNAGHFDVLGSIPVAKQLATNGAWLDDGLRWNARWEGVERGLRGLEWGVWKGWGYPGGAGAPPAVTARAHLGWDHIDAHISVAHLEPQGRGAGLRTTTITGHTHGSLDCRYSLRQTVCFDGQVNLLQASLQWESENQDWRLRWAGVFKRESGDLSSQSAAARYAARLSAGWIDLQGPLPLRQSEEWSWVLRLERAEGQQSVSGVGVATLAREAGFDRYQPVQRALAAVVWGRDRALQWSVEAGSERSAWGLNRLVAVRLVGRWERAGSRIGGQT